MKEALQQSVEQLFDDLEEFIETRTIKLGRWGNMPVNGDASYTLKIMLENLSETVGKVKARTHQQTMEEWTNSFRERHESMGMIVTFNELGDKINLTNNIQNELTCILQEACGNAVKHGKAGMIQILVTYKGEGLQITIADNGIGIKDSRSSDNGEGLNNMRSRTEALNGAFSLQERPEARGTIVMVELPKVSILNSRGGCKKEMLGHELHDILCPEIIGVSLMLANMKRQHCNNQAEKWYELQITEDSLAEYASKFRSLSHELITK